MPLLAWTKCISTFQATMVKNSVFPGKGYDIWKIGRQPCSKFGHAKRLSPPPHPLPCNHPFARPYWMSGPTDRWTDILSYAEARTHLRKVTIQSMNLSTFARNSRNGTERLGTARHGTARAESIDFAQTLK